MPRLGVPGFVLAAAALLLLLALWLFSTSPAAEAEREAERRRQAAAEAPLEAGAPSAAAAAPPALVVDAMTARSEPARQRVELAGSLEAVRRVTVGAEIEGRVIEVAVDEHLPVAEGDVLVRLDPALPGAAVERARAAQASARARAGLARADLARSRELSRQGVASSAELERAESEERTTRAAVAEAAAALHDVETRLRKTEIRAPFAAVVSSLELEPGAYLRPGDPVAELVDLSEIEVEVAVSDEEILALRDGDPATLVVGALPGRRFEARVLRPGRSADPRTRKYPVPVRVPNPDGLLLPGMLGTVRLELGEAASVLRIPSRAVQREFDLEFLYVLAPVAGNGSQALAERRRVKTRPVAFRPELLEVVEGLDAGERVALSGLRELRQGLRVRVRGGAGPAAAETAP